MYSDEILFALWLFSSAGVGTLLPVLAAHTPGMKTWNAPMDFGRSWRGRRIFGDHKTWRGFFAGWLGGSLWGLIQVVWYDHSTFIQSIYPPDFPTEQFFLIAVLISLGSVVGDAVGSFLKRQFDIPAGKSWFPADQLDFIIGGIVLSLPVVRLEFTEYMFILITWLVIHLFFGYLGYVTKFKDEII
jgi:CDP-2,3-bis-(O-geranylgeranyl)-sn-glycerol synthase